jgi:tetratricopeptide (TPR) repeat protein
MAKARPDVMRHRRGIMTEHLGVLFASRPEVREPFELGFAAMNACRWDEAIVHLQKAAAATKGLKQVALLNLIGVCHYTQGRLVDAFKVFDESAKLAEKFGDKRGKARAIGNIGLIYRDNGQLDSALKYFEEALTIARSVGHQWAVAIHLGYAGSIYHDKGELDKALEYYGEALAISREIGDQWVVASSLGNIGSIYHDRGELDKALQHHEQSLGMSRDNGDLWGAASSLSNIGSIYRDKGRLAQALKYENGALKVARQLGHLLGVATDLGNIGLIMADRSEHEQAVPKLAEALITLLNMGVANGPRQTLTGLAGCEDKLGRRRLVKLLEGAGRDDGVISDLLNRVDQMRQRRPERPIIPKAKRPTAGR